MIRVLVVDPDPQSTRLIRQTLNANGCQVLTALDAESAETMALEHNVDTVVTERQLRDTTGLAFIRKLRESSDVPVLMVSSHAAPDDVVAAFQTGADDYVPKPYNLEELTWRVRSLARRYKPEYRNVVGLIDLGELTINPAAREVMVREKLVKFSPTEYKLLLQLASNAGRVMRHDELLTKVWGREYREEVEYLRVYIRYVRQKVEIAPAAPQIILTEPMVGYWIRQVGSN